MGMAPSFLKVPGQSHVGICLLDLSAFSDYNITALCSCFISDCKPPKASISFFSQKREIQEVSLA